MKLLSLLVVSVFLLGVSCERHDFEETKQLHESHSSHGDHGDDGAHGEDKSHAPAH